MLWPLATATLRAATAAPKLVEGVTAISSAVAPIMPANRRRTVSASVGTVSGSSSQGRALRAIPASPAATLARNSGERAALLR